MVLGVACTHRRTSGAFPRTWLRRHWRRTEPGHMQADRGYPTFSQMRVPSYPNFQRACPTVRPGRKAWICPTEVRDKGEDRRVRG